MFYATLFLCLTFAWTASSSAASPSSSPYRLSFIIQPSDIRAGASLFATTVLTHPVKTLISNSAIQFEILDGNDRPVAGTSLSPVTTDSRGLAIFADTVLQPGKGYTLVARCGQTAIRSRAFDVIPPGPTYPLAATPAEAAPEDCDPPAAAPAVTAKPIKTAALPKELPVKPLPQAKEPAPIVIPNPNPGTAQETVVPAVAFPGLPQPTPMPETLPVLADAPMPAPLLPSAFDLVVVAPPVLPRDPEARGVVIPNPALRSVAGHHPY